MPVILSDFVLIKPCLKLTFTAKSAGVLLVNPIEYNSDFWVGADG